jgi:hypothetical protein
MKYNEIITNFKYVEILSKLKFMTNLNQFSE